MTTVHIDDVTGEEYAVNQPLEQFGILAYGDLWDDIDVHESTWTEDPHAVADELHEMIDEWAERTADQFGEESD